MLAKLVLGDLAPHRLPAGTRAVHEEFVPSFLEHRGARQGYWMANAHSGHVLAMTTWCDAASLEAARAADGAARARTAERLGLQIHAVQSMEVLGSRACDTPDRPVGRWARATWVGGISTDLGPSIRAVYQEVVVTQATSPGFCASFWLADPETGNGLALSMWESAADLRDGEQDSRRRRRHFERAVGCSVDLVTEYEVLAEATPVAVEPEGFPSVSPRRRRIGVVS